MKNKIFLLLIIIVLAGCKDSFLDTVPLTSKTNEDFYQTPEDMNMALTAAYAAQVDVPTGDGNLTGTYPFIISEMQSDDRFGGNNPFTSATAACEITNLNMFLNAWTGHYQGIFRCNMVLTNMEKPEWESESQKGKIEGQARFLRANYYFNLAKMFGEVPLILETAPVNLPKASADSIYAHITSDLKKAIEVFPNTANNSGVTSDLGRANKWAAEALMARVYLFYTGYYEVDALPLYVDDETPFGSVSKSEVVNWVQDCIDNSGYKLMDEFRNLWPYSYATSEHSDKPYEYAEKNNLEWYGEQGGNQETMYALKFSTFAAWNTTIYYSNQMNLWFGLPNYNYHATFGEGWAMGTVNPNTWNEWPDNDIRKKGSIIDSKDPDEGLTDYDELVANENSVDQTGLWQKKYIPVNVYDAENDQWSGYSGELYGVTRNFQLDNTQDIVLIRFADVLLMQAELTQDAKYLNEVRERVGLDPVAYSLDALKAERRHELAFEGLRYYDLLRWAGKSNLQEVKAILDGNQNGQQIVQAGKMYSRTGVNFRIETGGFLQIPNKEIQNSAGVLKQNPGWGDDAPIYVQPSYN